MAICILHNSIHKYDGFATSVEETSTTVSTFQNIEFQGGNVSRDAFNTKELFKNYFLSACAYNVTD